MIRTLTRLAVAIGMICAFAGVAAADIAIKIGYLKQEVERPPVLSNLEEHPDNEGLAGVRVALDDNNTTGKFLNQTYELVEEIVGIGGDIEAAAKALLSETPYLVVDAPMVELLTVADLPEAANAILFNVSAPDDGLRDGECRANILHTIPSRAMLADALAQFAVSKRWTNWVLLGSTSADDRALTNAYRRAAEKFRIKVRAEKEWTFEADMRRNAAQEVPLFTQDLPDHDMMIIADEAHDYGRYVMYNTWLPRPVAGSEGISPSGWSPSVEASGAVQLQNRFAESAGRSMSDIDYAAWAAVRVIGEAVTRTNSGDAATIRNYMFSDAFELAGFKGRPLTFRSWNGQMRQPIPITHPRALIANPPLEGFLHQRNELDTLGLDEPESACNAFN